MTLGGGAGLLELTGYRASPSKLLGRLHDRDCFTASDPVNQLLTGRLWGCAEGALPDDADTPTSLGQSIDCLKVASLVVSELLIPEIPPGLGQPEEGAALMAMPETAMYEDSSSPTLEYQVRPSRQPTLVKPVAETRPP